MAPRFPADPPLIKIRIQQMMEQSYLERDEHDKTLYRYLA